MVSRARGAWYMECFEEHTPELKQSELKQSEFSHNIWVFSPIRLRLSLAHVIFDLERK